MVLTALHVDLHINNSLTYNVDITIVSVFQVRKLRSRKKFSQSENSQNIGAMI